MDNYSFNTKYKERDPLKTVNIIRQFFEELGYKIEHYTIYRDSSLTWYAKVSIYHNNNLVLTTNGKGMEEDFAIASGYGEMYERYCNKMHFISNAILCRKVIEEHYKRYGYYFHPEEKIIDIDEILKLEKIHISPYETVPGQLKSVLKLLYNNTFIGVPYRNILNNEYIYLEPRINRFLRGSSGMACGNTIEEAFNQGFSELLEHHWGGLYLTDPFDIYYSINLNNINNEKILNCIKAIKASGQKLYLYDLSYNLNMPVVMGVLICKNRRIHANIAAFPIFDIAVERVITELYQGDLVLLDINQHQKQLPYKNYSIEFLEGTCTNSITNKQAFPEQIFFKTKIINQESDIYLKNNKANNLEIFKYYQNLSEQLNLEVYYHDVSLIESMKAINIYIKDFSVLSYPKLVTLVNTNRYDICYNFAHRLIKYCQNLTNNYICNIEELKQLSNDWVKLSNYEQGLVGAIVGTDFFSIYRESGQKTLLSIYILCNFLTDQGQQQLLELSYKDNYYNLSKYILLYSYCLGGKYEKNEIINIMNNIYNINYTQEDYQNILNIDYLIEKIFLKRIIDFYSKDNYNFLELLIKY